MTPSSAGDVARTARMARTEARSAARDSRGTSGAKHTTTRRSRPFSLRSSPHWRIISTNSRRLWSLCQSNLRRDLACFSRRHRRRMAKRAPPGAKSRQCRAGSLTIARGAGECAPSVSSWPCISSITSFATSWRSMGGAAGNALDSRTVMPSSLRRYASLCAGEGEGGGEATTEERRVRVARGRARSRAPGGAARELGRTSKSFGRSLIFRRGAADAIASVWGGTPPRASADEGGETTVMAET